jgi:PilZ domain.
MPRIEINCTAWIREGATVHRTRLINVSQGGLRVETPNDLAVGAEVVATLNGLTPEPAVVRWREDSSYGISFNRVLSLSQLVAWLQEQRTR